jgi:hypothetical protein
VQFSAVSYLAIEAKYLETQAPVSKAQRPTDKLSTATAPGLVVVAVGVEDLIDAPGQRFDPTWLTLVRTSRGRDEGVAEVVV